MHVNLKNIVLLFFLCCGEKKSYIKLIANCMKSFIRVIYLYSFYIFYQNYNHYLYKCAFLNVWRVLSATTGNITADS